MARRGLEVSFVGGRRVTTPEALEVVREALLAVNADLCAAIGSLAVPLAGDEIGLQATPVPELGLVGEALPTCPTAVVEALARGEVPVVAPLAEGPLNVNADDAAAALAVGIDADRILFVTDVPGLLLAAQSPPRLAWPRPSGCSTKARSPAGSSRSCALRSVLPGARQAEIGETAVVA